MIQHRLAALRALMDESRTDAILVTKYVNLQYFSGFRGDDTTLVVTKDTACLVTDNRYTEQAALQAPDYEIVEQKKGLWTRTAELIRALGVQNVGFEGSVLSFNHYRVMKKLLGSAVRFETSVNLDHLRQVKDEEELHFIREACRMADAAFEAVCSYMKIGMTEVQVAAYLERVMREQGSEKPSFDTIVASGLRGSMPHGTATEKKLEAGDFVTMDYGAKYQGYCSDITRTVVMGKADARQREVYEAVLDTQEKVLADIGPGKSGREIDACSRENLKRYGLDTYFGHGLGHSLGLEIHEEPRLSPSSTCESLVPGMLITDEPGVYLPGWGGLRIEDTVLVTATGSERLTKSQKNLIEIPQ